MPRNISFALTKEQFRDQSKTVTRRFGWKFLKAGDVLMAVEKGMGLKKGEKAVRMGMITVMDIRQEALSAITQEDCIREGFPEMSPDDFIQFLMKHHKCKPDDIITRIEFRYGATS